MKKQFKKIYVNAIAEYLEATYGKKEQEEGN